MRKIVNYLFVGTYGRTPGRIAHEWMDFVKADDGKRYIWLNKDGIYNYDDHADILLLKRVGKGLFQVLGKACDCEPVDGCNKRRIPNAVIRYTTQSAFGITYSGVALADIYAVPADTLVTFKCKRFMYPSSTLYITNKPVFGNHEAIYMPLTAKQQLREYCDKDCEKEDAFDRVFDDPTLWVDAEPDIISIEGWATAHAMSPLFSDFERETGRKLLEKIEELRNRN